MADQVLLVASIEGALIFIFCACMIYNYAAIKRTPFYVFIVSICSWFLAFMVIFLIPMDIFTVCYFYPVAVHFLNRLNL